MKKILCFVVAVWLAGCSTSVSDFRGFNGFDIGADFASLEVASAFRKTLENEYFLERMTFSDGIGPVEDVVVTTHEGKIIRVRFRTNEQTDKAKLDHKIAGWVEAEKMREHDDLFASIHGYSTPGDEITMMVSLKHRMLKGGKRQYEYDYCNRFSIEQDMKDFANSLPDGKAKRMLQQKN